ncbi:nuclear transcription factor Y subunit beta-like [Artemia franciscana]|uniref:EF-hand domain-containing protein n=1 Tax=Artemia franciscana TaxID=6661 RepID=A0AA88L1N0_ARTSF|nr:hypothetical protein QYM36_013682 [Artemia franciscana]
MRSIILAFFLAFHVCVSHQINGQKLPPGVNPQVYNQQVPQYQPPPPPQPGGQFAGQVPQQGQFQQQPGGQQQQQPQMQQQQAQLQQQQAQLQQQQFQQQQFQQQQPMGHGNAGHQGHGGHAGFQGQNILDAQHAIQDREHLKEHISVPVDTSKMTEQELQFHYFKMHDADNNNKLDGCELVKSLIHWHDQANHDPKAPHVPEPKIFTDEELLQMIDPILEQDDKNKDGFIDYPEFIAAQAAAAARD